MDDPGYYISSERGTAIFGDLPRESKRYDLDTEWMAHVRAGNEEAAEATAKKNYEESIAGTIPAYDAIYAVKRPIDGEIVWIHAMGQVVRDDDGNATDMWGVYQDITEQKNAEEELVKSKEMADWRLRQKVIFFGQYEPRNTDTNECCNWSYQLAYENGFNCKTNGLRK